jgi:hypothetical protein
MVIPFFFPVSKQFAAVVTIKYNISIKLEGWAKYKWPLPQSNWKSDLVLQ